ncbi:hypothetical protein HK413_01730 [Mucilaginibacter sp. S1162]|uniref:IPExxxVDY family protein n=1 Tax=Mucilaginibacter humi TaxID=2732510 RepID=A0ABX1W4I6_9SPHI|nr:hypothetical protein [Mucilaginibacter humi]NNU33210.1 hypothetical protein [Mucilaginibacter humi]
MKKDLNVEITEFVFLEQLNPSFIAVFIVNDYADTGLSNYQPCQLVLKISALAPVYSIHFDNLISDWSKRIVRVNSINEKELFVFDKIEENIQKYYAKFSIIDSSKDFQIVNELGNISISNTRKPYLDECLFGLYLSFHPHNIFDDRFKSKEYEIVF